MFTKIEKRIIGLILLFFLVGYTSQKITKSRVEGHYTPSQAATSKVEKGAGDTEITHNVSVELDSVVVAKSSDSAMININSASAKELEQVKGIGPKTASKIVRFREEQGPFVSLNHLTRVKGIGSKKLEKMKPFLKL